MHQETVYSVSSRENREWDRLISPIESEKRREELREIEADTEFFSSLTEYANMCFENYIGSAFLVAIKKRNQSPDIDFLIGVSSTNFIKPGSHLIQIMYIRSNDSYDIFISNNIWDILKIGSRSGKELAHKIIGVAWKKQSNGAQKPDFILNKGIKKTGKSARRVRLNAGEKPTKKLIGFPPSLVTELQRAADVRGVSFSRHVIEICEESLPDQDDTETPEP